MQTKIAPAAKQSESENLVVRAVTLGLVPEDLGPHPLGKDELWKMLHRAWTLCARAANASMRTLLAGDMAALKPDPKRSDKVRLEPLTTSLSTAAYHAARRAAEEMSSSPVADISQRVWKKYRAERFSIQVAASRSAPSFRRPHPLPIRKKDWQPVRIDEVFKGKTRGAFAVTFPLMDRLRDDRPIFKLVVKTARDAQLLERIWSDEWPHGTLEILPPGWNRRGRLRCKIVYYRPRPSSGREGGGTMNLRTGPDALLQASLPGGADYRWHHRKLRRLIVWYERDRLAYSEDIKHERRAPSRRRQTWRQDYGARREKHANRIKTTLQQIAAQVAGLAVRSGLDRVVYDDSERAFCDPFPWAQLCQELRRALQNAGIEMTIAEKENHEKTKPKEATARPSRRAARHSAGTADTKPCASKGARNGRAM